MPNITVKLNPSTKHIIKAMENLRRSVLDTKSPHQQIAVMLDAWVQRNFKSSGKKVGGWKPLALGGRWTGNGKNRHFDSSAKVLMDTGRLRASFLPFHNKKTAGIGSKLIYSKKHEEGDPPTLPQRRILPVSNEVNKEIIALYEKHIQREIQKFKGKL